MAAHAPDLLIRSDRVLLGRGLRPASVLLRDGRIVLVGERDAMVVGVAERDAGADVVMPGLVDTHVHVNDPGRTEWEGFATAVRAAAAGGVTTIFDMPLNSIPATTSRTALDAKRVVARRHALVNIGFIGGVVPGNAAEVDAMATDGMRLFKCFLVPSGVEEFPAVDERDLRMVLPILARHDATLMAHAELPGHLAPMPAGDSRRYDTYLASRPARAETEAVHLLVRLAEEYGVRVHVVHVSSEESLPILRDARERGVRVTAETCPHYLTFAAGEIADGATAFKCAPPIRDGVTREALWHALLEGDLDMVATDHSPCPPELKELQSGDFFQAWGGIASLQLGLAATWTAASERGGSVAQVARWLGEAPAHLAGLGTRKGRIAAGFDADLVIWDPEATWDVDAGALEHRHHITPYAGRTLRGAVRASLVAGTVVYDDGTFSGVLPGTIS